MQTDIREWQANATPSEVLLMMFITAITNFAMLPTIVGLYQRDKTYEFYLGTCLMSSSFIYHFLDSIQREMFVMNLGKWHKIDNITAIAMFITGINQIFGV